MPTAGTISPAWLTLMPTRSRSMRATAPATRRLSRVFFSCCDMTASFPIWLFVSSFEPPRAEQGTGYANAVPSPGQGPHPPASKELEWFHCAPNLPRAPVVRSKTGKKIQRSLAQSRGTGAQRPWNHVTYGLSRSWAQSLRNAPATEERPDLPRIRACPRHPGNRSHAQESDVGPSRAAGAGDHHRRMHGGRVGRLLCQSVALDPPAPRAPCGNDPARTSRFASAFSDRRSRGLLDRDVGGPRHGGRPHLAPRGYFRARERDRGSQARSRG